MSTFLLLGGTGKVGRRLATQLHTDGHEVRIASRNPPAGGVRFDWDDAQTHDPALEGADGVWVVPPALRLDHASQVGAFAERARRAGVSRLAVLSARGGNLDPASPLARMEAAVAASGAPHTVIRPAWFMQNFTEAFFAPGIVEQGVIAAPTGDGAAPFIDTEDIAAVAAAALTGHGGSGEAYDLSGPRALSFAEVAEVISDVTGRQVRHVDPGEEAWKAGAIEAGLPPAYADLLAVLFGIIRDGHDAMLSGGVQAVLGREPGSFEAWAKREAPRLAAQPVGA
jgi:uncharacterized protein YbjT (DUF2867 family)